MTQHSFMTWSFQVATVKTIVPKNTVSTVPIQNVNDDTTNHLCLALFHTIVPKCVSKFARQNVLLSFFFLPLLLLFYCFIKIHPVEATRNRISRLCARIVQRFQHFNPFFFLPSQKRSNKFLFVYFHVKRWNI